MRVNLVGSYYSESMAVNLLPALGQESPIWPLIQPARKMDFLLVSDSCGSELSVCLRFLYVLTSLFVADRSFLLQVWLDERDELE